MGYDILRLWRCRLEAFFPEDVSVWSNAQVRHDFADVLLMNVVDRDIVCAWCAHELIYECSMVRRDERVS